MSEDARLTAIQRFDSEPSGMQEVSNGEYVLFSDVEALLASHARAVEGRQGWQLIDTLPSKEIDVFFWVVPKTPEEAYCDTSGDPIFGTFKPHIHRGKHGTWSSLSKALYWYPMLPDPEVVAARLHEPEQEIEHLKAEMRAKPEDYPNLLRINREYAARCEAENDALRAALSAKDQQIAHLQRDLDIAEETVIHEAERAKTAETALGEARQQLVHLDAEVNTNKLRVSMRNAELVEARQQLVTMRAAFEQSQSDGEREARQQLAALRDERDAVTDESYLLRQRAVKAETELAEALAFVQDEARAALAASRAPQPITKVNEDT